MKASRLMIVYAGFALLGAVLPWYFNLRFMEAHPGAFELGAFLAGGFANPAASSLSSDLLIGATAFLVWMVVEARRLGMRHWWIYLVLTNLVAFAFAAPLFLFMRERKLREAPREPGVVASATAP